MIKFLCQLMTVPGGSYSLFDESQVLRIIISKAPSGQDQDGRGLAALVSLMHDNDVLFTDISYKFAGNSSAYELRGTKQDLRNEIAKLGPTYAAQTLNLALYGDMDKLHFCQCHEPDLIPGVADLNLETHNESSVMSM